MSRLLATGFAGSVIFSFIVTGPARAQAKTAGALDTSGLGITVRLYNYAQVPPDYLRHAQREASRILREAGIDTVWVDCPLSPVEAGQYPVCGEHLAPSNVVLRTLPESMVPQWGRDSALFGYALPASEGGFGVMANVFFHRVHELRREIQTLPALRVFSPGVILGHLMAHELGHLLLGGNSHARTGIMQFPMGRDQLLKIPKGQLLFTNKQTKSIRKNVRGRMEAAELMETSAAVSGR